MAYGPSAAQFRGSLPRGGRGYSQSFTGGPVRYGQGPNAARGPGGGAANAYRAAAQRQQAKANQSANRDAQAQHAHGGTPGAPGAPGAPGGNQAPQTANPYDAQYYSGLANAYFNANNRINQFNQQGAYAATDLNTGLANLARQQPIDTLNAQEQANKAGLLYSGQLGQTVGRLNQSYLDRQSAAQQQFDRGDAARRAAVAALRAGLPLEQAALAAAAAERASTAAANDPSLGEHLPGGAGGGAGGGGSGGGAMGGGPGGGAEGARRASLAAQQQQHAAASAYQDAKAQHAQRLMPPKSRLRNPLPKPGGASRRAHGGPVYRNR